MNHLDALEIMDWAQLDKNKLVIGFIKHLMLEDYTVHVSIMQAKTIVTLINFEGVAIKTMVLRHWLNSYAGMQIVGSGAFALINNEWINL